MKTRWWIWPVLMALLVGVLVLAFFTARSRTERWGTVDPVQRRAAYEANLDAFAKTCEQEEIAKQTEHLCRTQAATLRQFPECDASCLQRTAPYLEASPPTR